MSPHADDGLVSIAADGDRVVLRDEQTDAAVALAVSRSPALEPAPTEPFVFPVDGAAAVMTEDLRVPPGVTAYLRDETGDHMGEFSETPRDLPEGTYYLELEGAVKAYVRLPRTAARVGYKAPHGDGGVLRVALPEPTQLEVGVRSIHHRPEATVTVPDDPRALMDAVSVMGSSIKEFSPERSWPTLRGHPPAFEVGEELHIPQGLGAPDTGVTITVPESLADVYRVAPLAFYLGASVEPGDSPAVHLENGYTEPLTSPRESLSATVDRLLATCVTLDTLARTDGYYALPRYEYDELAPHLPFYPPHLYDEPLVDQLLEYFEVPLDALTPHVPRWPGTAVLRPTIEDAALLPHLVHRLWRVHVGPEESRTPPSPPVVTGSTRGTPAPGTARLSAGAFDAALDTRQSSRSEATAAVVTTDRERAAAVTDALADTTLDADRIRVRVVGATDELRDALAADVDVLHVDAPAESTGVAPGDGALAASDADTVGAPVAVVAGSGAPDVGGTLTAAGAVSVLAVPERPSADAVARVLELALHGYTLPTCARYVPLDSPYTLFGCPTMPAVRADGQLDPTLVDVASHGPDEHALALRRMVSDDLRLGSVVHSIESFTRDVYHLAGVTIPEPGTFTTDAVVDMLHGMNPESVVRLNGRLVSDPTTVTPALLRETAGETRQDAR